MTKVIAQMRNCPVHVHKRYIIILLINVHFLRKYSNHCGVPNKFNKFPFNEYLLYIGICSGVSRKGQGVRTPGATLGGAEMSCEKKYWHKDKNVTIVVVVVVVDFWPKKEIKLRTICLSNTKFSSAKGLCPPLASPAKLYFSS